MVSFDLSNFVDMHHVGALQFGCGACFLQEAIESLLVSGNFSRENLDRHQAIQLGILRQIHITHPARADLRADFKAAEFCAGGDRH